MTSRRRHTFMLVLTLGLSACTGLRAIDEATAPPPDEVPPVIAAGEGGGGEATHVVSASPETTPTALGCRPGGGGPYWIEEGQEVTVKVACTSGLDVDGSTFKIKDLPQGASYDPETAQLRWLPRLDQAGVYALTISAGNESATVKIGVADRFDAPGNMPIEQSAAYTEELGLPVFHLWLDAKIGSVYTPATVVYKGHTYKAQAKHKGNSSLTYPKKSFTIEFPKDDRFTDPNAGGGFFRKRKLALRSNFDDNSHLRERMAYEVWNRVGSNKIRVQTFSAAVYINGAYAGLYTVIDHIDIHLMEENGLSKDGDIFKAVGPDANFFPRDPISDVYEKTAGKPAEGEPGAFEDIQALTDFIMKTPDEPFRAQLPARIRVEDYVSWLITATAIQADDTLGKNSYHYHNPAGGLWRVVIWDFNNSWGQDWATGREAPDQDPTGMAFQNRLFERLMHDEQLGPQTRKRYREALDHEMALPDMLDAFDGLVEEVAPAAKRDERRWREQYLGFERWSARTDFTDFDREVVYLRQWIRDRWAYLEKLF